MLVVCLIYFRRYSIDNAEANIIYRLISWSKIGLIAYAPPISPAALRGGSTVYTRYIQCVDGESWDLSPPQILYDASKMHEDNSVTHLSWSCLGMELAVVDVQGRLSIFAHSGLMNQITCVYQSEIDRDSDLNAIVGFKWLNMNKPV